MKFKKILKKALKYVFTPLALIGGIIGLYSIDSYAYNTNQFTNTINSISLNNTSINLESFTISSNGSTLVIDSIDSIYGDYVLLINFDFSVSGVNLINSNYRLGSSSSVSSPIYINSNNTHYTLMCDFSKSTFQSYFGLDECSVYNLNSGMVINNVDVVKKSDLYLSYYYETYIQNLNNQIAQLQNDYDTLENNYNTLENNYNTLENNYNTLENNYNTLENEYEQKQNEYDMLTNGQLGYLSYMEFYINNQSVEFGDYDETELNLNDLVEYNLYSNNSLNLSYFTTQQVNPNYYPLTISSYYNELPVNLLSMYFNGGTVGIIKFGYYSNSQYFLKQISFDNTVTAVDSINTSLINYDVFKGLNVDYIEYIEIQFNNADSIAGSINFNSTYNIAYSSGYSNGYNYGYNVSNSVNSDKINNARQEGYQNGYDVGKQDGIALGSDESNSLYGVVIRTLLTLQYLFLNKYLTLIF